MARKPKPATSAKANRPRVTTPEGLIHYWHVYPKLTLATLATIITILTSIAPFVSQWYSDFVRRVEFNDYKKQALRDDRWRDVRAYRVEATIARNRLNDCNIMKQNKQGLTKLERAVCDQYEDDLKEATRKLIEAQSKALSISQGGTPEEGKDIK